MSLLFAGFFGFLIFLIFSPFIFIQNQKRNALMRRLHHVSSYGGKTIVTPEDQMSFLLRFFGPAWSNFSLRISGYTPVRVRRRIAEKLVEAGNPKGLKFDSFIGVVVITTFLLGLLGFFLGLLFNKSMINTIIYVAAGGGIGFLAPGFWLYRWLGAHKRQILRQMPE